MDFILNILLFAVAIFVSLAVHEVAHGAVAYSLGDPTAKMQGRLNFNPLVHIDMFGTVLVPMILLFAGAPVFGWAKPVPVNHKNFKNPVRDTGLTALAGPVSNFVMALFAAFLITYTREFVPNVILNFLWIFFHINIILGVFNFLPVAPLDGSKIIGLLVPQRFHMKYLEFLDKSTIYFVLILLFDIYMMPSIIGYSIFGKVVGVVMDYAKFLIFSST